MFFQEQTSERGRTDVRHQVAFGQERLYFRQDPAGLPIQVDGKQLGSIEHFPECEQSDDEKRLVDEDASRPGRSDRMPVRHHEGGRFAQHGGEIGRALRPRHQVGTLHTLHFQQLELEQHLRCIFQVADGVDGEAIEPLARRRRRLVTLLAGPSPSTNP